VTVVESYIKAHDNANDYADDLIAKLEPKALVDIDGLMRGDDARDEELWTELGINSELSIADYEVDPREDRDLEWTLGLAGLSAASSTQFFLDNREETIIKPVAYREQVLSGFVLTQAQLVQAGKRSVTIVSEARYVALQSRFIDELSFLREMRSVELYETLLDYGAMRPADQLIADQVGYVSRMTRYQPGSTQFKEEVSRLIDRNSTRVLKGQNRRAVEGVSAFREADGDLDTLMVWIVEGGKGTCDYCLDMAGTVATYREFLDEIGTPGSDICKGGDLCRCHLGSAE